MKKVTYSRQAIQSQTKMKSLKYMRALEAGTELTVTGTHKGSYQDDQGKTVINDSILTRSSNGEVIKIAFTDYTAMAVTNGDLFTGDSDNDVIELPSKIVIVSAKDKTTSAGEPMLPLFAYEGIESFNKNEIDFNGLLETGVKTDREYSALQAYTVELQH